MSVGNTGINLGAVVMRELYHYPLDAFGRIVRVYLQEKSIEYQEIEETFSPDAIKIMIDWIKSL